MRMNNTTRFDELGFENVNSRRMSERSETMMRGRNLEPSQSPDLLSIWPQHEVKNNETQYNIV